MLLGFAFAAIGRAEPPASGIQANSTPAAAEVGALAAPGDTVGGARVDHVELHPEYERYWLVQPDGRIAVAEVVTGEGGLCDVGGMTIYPRPELSGVDGTVGMDALCARLAPGRPALRPRRGEGVPTEPAQTPPDERSPGSEDVQAAYRLTWVLPLLLGVGVLGLLRARVDRMLLGLGAFALGVRLLFSPLGVINGELAGYEKLVLARGTIERPPYGLGWGALMGLVPGWPDGVFWTDLLLASLAAPLLAVLVRREAGSRAGLAAGLFFALLSTHVGVSGTETMHVPVLTLSLIAAVAADAFGRRAHLLDGLLAAAATGIAVSIRPDALAFAPVPVGLVLLRRGRELGRNDAIVGAFLVGLVLACAATLGPLAAGGLVHPPTPRALLPRLSDDRGGFQLFWHARFTPPALAGLALVGVASLWRTGRGRVAAMLLAWALLTTFPLLEKSWPNVDAVRLQLLGQAPWVSLAGIGAAALPVWVIPLAAVTMLPWLRQAPYVQTEEWRFLRSTVPTLPEGVTVRYDGRPQRARSFGAVMETLGPARWSTTEGDWRYIGLSCAINASSQDNDGCATLGCTPWHVAPITGRADADLTLSPGATFGFWRCE